MRIGSNPEKFNKEILSRAYHRVVVPVYIPNSQGYFKDALEVLRLNIESLLLTVHDKTRITIYNNNSTSAVKAYIEEIYDKHEVVDQVFHSKENLGKINAILAAVKGNLEPLITITDSDVLFEHDWQKNVESVFLNFPCAGMVSPVPNSVAYKHFTANNWFSGIVGSSRIRFEDVRDPVDMKRFESSLGTEVKLFSDVHLKRYLVLMNDKGKAVMGSGHFVATLRREVFDKGSTNPAFIKIQGGVENMFIDIPNEDLGYLRLSTLTNHAFHMGNVPEQWMQEEFGSLRSREPNQAIEDTGLFYSRPLKGWKIFIGKALRKLLLHGEIKTRYFKLIGLENGARY